MRDAIEFAQRSSAWGRGKVVLVYPAESMNTVSANALLKTLEEPAGDVRFVLASEAAQQLLPTIRSRCLGHAMAWPGAEELAPWLAGQGMDAEAAAIWLRAAGGRPDDALALATSGMDARHWSALPRAVQQGDIGAMQGWTPAEIVGTLHKICHDMQLHACGAEPRFFRTRDLPTPPAFAALSQWGQALARTARTMDHPFNPGLMYEALLSQAKNALNSSH
jgi:DNA polymerase-3 subunit delta'